MTQLELPEPRTRKRKLSQLDHIEEIMSDGKWRVIPSLPEAHPRRGDSIRDELLRRGVVAMDTGISARIRELPSKRGRMYEKRPVAKGSNLNEYRMVK